MQKCVRDPSVWKRNVNKKLMASGSEYKTKSGKLMSNKEKL